MKRLIFTFVLVVVIIFWASDTLGTPQPVPEPQFHTTTGWDITPTGMLIVGYDLNGNGRPDYFTLRIVVRSYFSADSVQTTVENCQRTSFSLLTTVAIDFSTSPIKNHCFMFLTKTRTDIGILSTRTF